MNTSEAISTYWPSWLSWNLTTPVFVFVIIVATFFFARLVDRFLLGYFKKVSLKLKVDPTGYRLLRHLSVAAIYIFGLIIIVSSVPQLRTISVALFAGAGFAGIIIGLAAQSTLANIISGISLAMFQPFRVGDLVSIHEEYGTISDLTLRHTVVTTWDNRRLIIPNSIISDEAVINWSIEDPTVIWPVNIGISYDSDIDLARSIMLEEARKHPNVMEDHDVRIVHPGVLKGSEVKVLVTELGDFAVNLRLLVWVRNRGLAYVTGCELMESIKKRFDAEGIEIPFPYRTLVYKRDLPPNVQSQEGLVDVPDAGSDETNSQGS
ncbi:MAG: Large-conductance mechanosensitive channel MscMJLR [Candidatus Methanocomedens sp.]|nr:MAG: Large-conductance mechanosensitive channel MscMJLR [ANME-2 cluster archaeon]